MRKFLIIIIFCQFLTGCHCDDAVVIDMGPIPERILSQVPYENGKHYLFQHSGGLIIDFVAERLSRNENSWCERCCQFLYKYQVNETILHPDYPIFDFNILINGQDTLHSSPLVWIGRSMFYLPGNNPPMSDIEYSDSIKLNKKWYYGIYALKNSSDPMFNRDSIYSDSLYYNNKSGIIRIVMTNGESYQVYE